MVGTRQQNIARIENPAYQGHSLSLLRRIARTLGLVVHVDFIPAADIVERYARPASSSPVPQEHPAATARRRKQAPLGRRGKAQSGV
jgi:hypothetical protein